MAMASPVSLNTGIEAAGVVDINVHLARIKAVLLALTDGMTKLQEGFPGHALLHDTLLTVVIGKIPASLDINFAIRS